jgi:predicted permease
MNWLRKFLTRGEVYGDLSDEIRAHLEERVDELVADGRSRKQALEKARREFGNATLIEERGREAWGWRGVEDMIGDVKFGARMLGKNPGFAAIAILTLAVGIGANATVFSWIRAVLLDPLPGAAEPERIVAIEEQAPSGDPVMASYLDFRDFRDHLKLIQGLSVEQAPSFAVGNDTYVERVWGEIVSGNFFDLLGVKPEVGRFFSSAESTDAQNAHPVVVISDAYWRSHFNASTSAIGTVVKINKHPFTVIGVAPPDFHGSMAGFAFDMWAPATMFGQLTSTGDWMLNDRKTRMFRVIARLAPGVTIDQARIEVKTLAGVMATLDADTNEGMSATVLPLWQSHFGLQASLLDPLSILMATSAVVLLIVCANLANLLLARATSRRKEFSMRLALGASRSRLVRQMLTETILLGGAGLVLGVFLAQPFLGSLHWLIPAGNFPSLEVVKIDLGVVAYTATIALLVAALAGIAPALQASGEHANEALKESGRHGSASARTTHLRGLLIISEMALAVLALVGAGLFLKSFYMTKAVKPGFDANGVAIAHFNLSAAGFDAAQADAFCRHLRERLERQPGVTAVSYGDYVPLSVSAGSWEDLQIEGYVPGQSENMKIYRNLVAPGYFGLMKIPMFEGRDFTMQDDREHAPVMIVTREFVRRFVPSGIAIGRKVQGWGKWFTIVGVVDDVKVLRLTEQAAPYFYVPIRQIYRPEMGLAFYVRTSGSVAEAAKMLTREAQALDATVPVYGATPLSDYTAESMFTQRIAASLLSVMAGIALLLAAIGLYGVMAYAVSQRTHEIGIRVALGARPGNVMRMVIRQALALAAIGIFAGSAVAIALGRIVASSLTFVKPTDAIIYGAAWVFAVAIALVATAIPAWRAMKVDPIIALRCQ